MQVDAFDTFAAPSRHPDYSVEEIKPARLLHERCVMIAGSAPGRAPMRSIRISFGP